MPGSYTTARHFLPIEPDQWQVCQRSVIDGGFWCLNTRQSKGLPTTQLAPQGAAAGDPSNRPRLSAIDCSFGQRAAAAWGVRLLSSLWIVH